MVSKVEKQEFAQYLGEARSWETSRIREVEKSRRTAWLVAISSCALTLVSVLAVAMLTPLKTVEPYVIRVDNVTGVVDVVTALKDGKTNYDEAMNKYFTQQYVRWREGYSFPLAKEYYTNVGLFSARNEQAKYLQVFSPRNPQSPLNVYGENGTVTVQIKSTSFISEDVASVRYLKQVNVANDPPKMTHWVATIHFKYLGALMREKDRAINPLGFQVLEYRNDPDQQVSDTTTVAPITPINVPPLQSRQNEPGTELPQEATSGGNGTQPPAAGKKKITVFPK